MAKGKDISGCKYGRLTAVKLSYRDNKSNSFWLCVCVCGNESVVTIRDLNSGNTTSCGCFRIEQSNKALVERSFKHGGHGSRLYNIWHGMKQRCQYPKSISYKRYGGRGIRICEEWKTNFKEFRDWAMKNGYTDDKSIDRIDNNGNYEPANCRWSTVKVQSNNRSSNKIISHNGMDKTLSEWSEVKGIKTSTLSMRLASGWSVKDALETPVGNYNYAKT